MPAGGGILLAATVGLVLWLPVIVATVSLMGVLRQRWAEGVRSLETSIPAREHSDTVIDAHGERVGRRQKTAPGRGSSESG